MSLIADIKRDQLKARMYKNTATASLLTTLIGEVDMVGLNAGKRETTDVETVTIIKKFIKNSEENAQHWNHRNPESQNKRQVFLKEIEILEKYVPTQLSESDMTKILVDVFKHEVIIPSLKGKMMKYLKDNHAGKYDGKVAAGVVDAILAVGKL